MSNAINADNLLGISNFVDYTIVIGAYPQSFSLPLSFRHPGGRGFLESALIARTIRS